MCYTGELRYDGCLTEDPDGDNDGYWVVLEWSSSRSLILIYFPQWAIFRSMLLSMLIHWNVRQSVGFS